MTRTIVYMLMAVLAGAMMPTQAATNNKMAGVVDSPLIASLISFLVGTLAIAIYMAVTGTSFGNLASAKDAPPIAWIGGLFGAFFVVATVMLVPRIGVALTFSLVIAGQMLVTLVIDHYGLLGIDVRPVSWARIAGIVLITLGVVLIRRF